MTKYNVLFSIALGLTLLTAACAGNDSESVSYTEHTPSPVEWSYDATIYEVNVRQFSEEGSFARVEEALPRIKELGIDIVWLMPVHPIGEIERKGTLGSYYSVKDYFDVNPEFGTKDDLRSLIETAHSLDMKVILDWVANHTAWDNPLTETNPEFFETDENGNFIPPRGTDWSDVIQLDYDNPDVHDYMISALKYWVEEFNIDGYRADVAYLVPTEFWERARRELDEIKPVFMLAEAHEPELHPAFDMGYNWEVHHIMNRIASGENTVADLEQELQNVNDRFGREVFMMNFITNHDENSWAGTEFNRLGDGVEAFAVLMTTLEGMPLIYNGQETGFDHMLEFFEKDPIVWDFDSPFQDFYSTLFHLKREHPALQNGIRGGELVRINTSDDEAVFAFSRSMDGEHVVVVLNLSDSDIAVTLEETAPAATYVSLFGDNSSIDAIPTSIDMEAWEYHVFVSTN